MKLYNKKQNFLVFYIGAIYRYIDTLGAISLGNILAGKGMNRIGGVFIRAGYES